MGHVQKYIGHSANQNGKYSHKEDFVLEKSIFSNVFEKDIRRVFIFKKAESIAKAMHLITPAFAKHLSLKKRVDDISVELVEAAMLTPGDLRAELPKTLLALSSILSMARVSGILSSMNVDIIAHEVQQLLGEITGYEDTALMFEEVPSISTLARANPTMVKDKEVRKEQPKVDETNKGQVKDTQKQEPANNDRKSLILGIIQSKGNANIKDISMVVRGVSEKTVQRELIALVESGVVRKTGERRWSTYSLA